jgi:hypothetical protein
MAFHPNLFAPSPNELSISHPQNSKMGNEASTGAVQSFDLTCKSGIQEFGIQLSANATVGDLKKKIQSSTNIPPHLQQFQGLWKKGQPPPKDNTPLSALQIPFNHTFSVSKKKETRKQQTKKGSNGSQKKAGQEETKTPKVQFQLRTLKQTLEEIETKWTPETEKVEADVKAFEEQVAECCALDGGRDNTKDQLWKTVNELERECVGTAEKLMHVLESVDAIDGEDEEVRTSRKVVVKAAQALMERLDTLKDQKLTNIKHSINSMQEDKEEEGTA